jgi:epsilon-lactone hydrolase
MEVGTQVLRRQLAIAFKIRDVRESRRYLNSSTIGPEVPEVRITRVAHSQFQGSWFIPNSIEPGVTLLYFHGGGYSFYPRGYTGFIALLGLATKSRTFALDYRLSPEHRFPTQLEDALHAYRWLLETTSREELVVAGDSAGGNLALALLLAARDAKLALPALAILLSPATGFQDENSMLAGAAAAYDWIDPRMVERWANWFCDSTERKNLLVSPILADLRHLPPIYIQAGRDEILFPTIQAFANRAKDQGADIELESWDYMNHVFQVFGPEVSQSAEALRRIGQMIDGRVRHGKPSEPTVKNV